MKKEIAWKEILESMNDAVQGELPSVSQIHRETGDPFQILISTILSLRTRDEVTLSASRRLFKVAKSPQSMGNLEKEKLEQLIYPSAFFRNKAENILRICHILQEQYQGEVPRDQKALLALPGVGLKTANLVLSLAFNQEAICVDIHVHRMANRMGWVNCGTPDQTEEALRAILPRQFWISINEIMVAYGQQICTPQSPKCSICPIESHCLKRDVNRSR